MKMDFLSTISATNFQAHAQNGNFRNIACALPHVKKQAFARVCIHVLCH